MKIAVYKPGHNTPLYVGACIDDCLAWIGNQIGCNWAKRLDTVAHVDGSYNVVATRTGMLLDFTLGPIH